jgi:hypothetical protein
MNEPTREAGTISDFATYTREEIKVRLGVKRTGWERLLAAGLPIKKIGRRAFVNGKQFNEFLRNYESN